MEAARSAASFMDECVAVAVAEAVAVAVTEAVAEADQSIHDPSIHPRSIHKQTGGRSGGAKMRPGLPRALHGGRKKRKRLQSGDGRQDHSTFLR